MYLSLETRCKNFLFTMIIEYYAPLLEEKLQKFLIHEDN